jgi:hypothetical protein
VPGPLLLYPGRDSGGVGLKAHDGSRHPLHEPNRHPARRGDEWSGVAKHPLVVCVIVVAISMIADRPARSHYGGSR